MKKITIFLLGVCFLAAFATTSFAANDFKLKPGARGKLCLKCHVDFSERLKKPVIHTPVREGDCSSCHNPHASDHGKLLAEDPGKICSVCHPNMVPEQAASVHKVVAEENCTDCHDPHSSDFKNNLVRGGNKLCFGCHEDMATAVKDLKFPHAPVSDDCLSCHNPHASEKGKHLLTSNPPELCKECHDTSGKQFSAIHMDYPVAEADCTLCHNPHGSNQKHLLYDHVHPPVAKRMCNQCHEDAKSADPLKLKRPGYQLCQGCHNDMVNNFLSKNRVHWPLVSKRGCLECHSPHASKGENLLPGPQIKVCGECHADTLRRQELSPTKHEPVNEGDCSTCHNPHASDYNFLAQEATVIDLCGTCHDWQTHSTHPIGDKFQDKRNPNMNMNCLSCHRSHGTDYQKMIPFATISVLCVQCHQQYTR